MWWLSVQILFMGIFVFKKGNKNTMFLLIMITIVIKQFRNCLLGHAVSFLADKNCQILLNIILNIRKVYVVSLSVVMRVSEMAIQ